jgi:hypothetical protein
LLYYYFAGAGVSGNTTAQNITIGAAE